MVSTSFKNQTLIDDVIVSTDCHEIAEISKTEGASVPFMRPKDLAMIAQQLKVQFGIASNNLIMKNILK